MSNCYKGYDVDRRCILLQKLSGLADSQTKETFCWCYFQPFQDVTANLLQACTTKSTDPPQRMLLRPTAVTVTSAQRSRRMFCTWLFHSDACGRLVQLCGSVWHQRLRPKQTERAARRRGHFSDQLPSNMNPASDDLDVAGSSSSV